jgi:DNA polymerase-3 subunit alpha
MEECQRMGVPVLGPDINESQFHFSVNRKGQIRFGLGAIKGVGEAAVEALINERNLIGPFVSIFDLTQRVSGKNVNKRCLESLAQGGAFDCFEGSHRAQYFSLDKDNNSGIERALRFGNNMAAQAGSNQVNLFGDVMVQDVTVPALDNIPKWSKLEELRKEKEVIGFYVSGHPLDDFRFEIDALCSHNIEDIRELDKKMLNREVSFAGIITDVNHRMTKTGKPFGSFTVEDFSGNTTITLFGEDYGKLKQFLEPESLVFIRAKIQGRFGNNEELELKPYQVQYLGDVGEKLIRQLVVKMRLHDVRSGLIPELGLLLDSHKGSVPVRLQIVDVEKNWNVPMISKLHKVKVHNELVNALKNLTNGEVVVGA